MRKHVLCIRYRIACVYTRDLMCMHNTLVHAVGQGTQGPAPKNGAWGSMGYKATSYKLQAINYKLQTVSHKL